MKLELAWPMMWTEGKNGLAKSFFNLYLMYYFK